MPFVETLHCFWKKFLTNLRTNRALLDIFGSDHRRSRSASLRSVQPPCIRDDLSLLSRRRYSSNLAKALFREAGWVIDPEAQKLVIEQLVCSLDLSSGCFGGHGCGCLIDASWLRGSNFGWFLCCWFCFWVINLWYVDLVIISLLDQFLLRQFRKKALDWWLTPGLLLRSVDFN